MMKVGFESRKLCGWLFILTWVTFASASEHCTFDKDCGPFARCKASLISGDRSCFCKYGSLIIGKSNAQCKNQCDKERDCVSDAKCDLHIFSENKCTCKYGGSLYEGEELIYCDAPPRTLQIVGGVIGALIFILLIVGFVYCIRDRWRAASARTVSVGVQPSPVSQQIPMLSPTTQPIYPTPQYYTAEPAEKGFSKPGYGYSQPPPYSPEEHK